MQRFGKFLFTTTLRSATVSFLDISRDSRNVENEEAKISAKVTQNLLFNPPLSTFKLTKYTHGTVWNSTVTYFVVLMICPLINSIPLLAISCPFSYFHLLTCLLLHACCLLLCGCWLAGFAAAAV